MLARWVSLAFVLDCMRGKVGKLLILLTTAAVIYLLLTIVRGTVNTVASNGRLLAPTLIMMAGAPESMKGAGI